MPGSSPKGRGNSRKQRPFNESHPVVFWGAIVVCAAALVLVFVSSIGFNWNQPKTLTAIAALGPISGADVNVYELNDDGTRGSLVLGPLKSDATGSVDFSFPAEVPKRLLVESAGGVYRDEATGTQTQLSGSDVMRAVLPAGTRQVAVTPFTDMAASLAATWMGQGVPAGDAVTNANIAVAQQYQVPSILEVVPVAANDPTAVGAADLEGRKYSALLAGLAQEAHDMNVRPIDLARALSSDWSDGTVDGQANGRPIMVSDLSGGLLQLGAGAGIADLQAASNDFLDSEQDATKLRQIYISLTPVNADARFAIATASLPYWESGKHGAFTIAASGGRPPYTWALKQGSALPAGFSLSKDGVLSGQYTLSAGVTKSVSPPFVVTVSDSSSPKNTREIELRITIIQSPPQLTLTSAKCYAGKQCSVQVAIASGGTPPYYFTSDSFGGGAPPMGMIVDMNGKLTGRTRVSGTHTYGVCVVDSVGLSSCGTTDVNVEGSAAAEPFNLTLEWTGTGSGALSWSRDTVTPQECGKSPDGVHRCVLAYLPGTSVTISNEPDEGSEFAGWSGACAGTGECTVTVDADKTVTVDFRSLAETWSGRMTGTVDMSKECAFCDGGSVSIALDISFSSRDNIVDALLGRGEYSFYEGTGLVGSTTTAGQQPVPNDDECTCQLITGNTKNIPVLVYVYGGSGAQTISVTGNSTDYPLYYAAIRHVCDFSSGRDVLDHGTSGSIQFNPTAITNDTISGTWGDWGTDWGTFTLTKQ